MKHLFILSLNFIALIGWTQVQIDQAIQLTGTGSNAKVTGIEEVNSAEDATSAESIQKNAVTYAAATNLGNTYSVSLIPAPVAYTTGMTVHFRASADITGSALLNVNGLGAQTIKKNYDVDLEANDIKNGQMVSVIYDGVHFQMLSQLGNAAGGAITAKRAFVSSGATYTGNLGGISGADAICQGLANGASLGGNWKAFLSTSTTNAIDRSSYSGRIVNMRGQVLSENGWAGLMFYIPSRIFWDQTGTPLPSLSNEFVHTGSTAFGTTWSTFNCSNWTSASTALNTVLGLPFSSTYEWISYTETNCSNPRRLYCIED